MYVKVLCGKIKHAEEEDDDEQDDDDDNNNKSVSWQQQVAGVKRTLFFFFLSVFLPFTFLTKPNFSARVRQRFAQPLRQGAYENSVTHCE